MTRTLRSTSTRRVAVACLLAITVGACDAGSDVDDGSDDDIEVDAPRGDDADESVDDEDAEADDEAATADGIDPSAMSDDELVDVFGPMSDEEFDDATADLDDDEYDELLDRLDAATADEESIDEPTEESDDESDVGSDDGVPEAAAGSRDDVDCSDEGLGADETFSFTTAHFVVDGVLGDVCFGEPDQRVVDAWNDLAVIAPQGQLADLGTFAGFESGEDGEEITLAFVNALDADGSLFQMSINLDAATQDPAEAQLTMAHEFAHVFTQIPSQLDWSDEAIDDCDTYDNGSGCLRDDSLLYRWIEEFWGDGLIDDVDPDGEATGDSGAERCADDAGFFGSYGASTPDEDFAESFSAYVLGIELATPEQQERVDWLADQPGLVEFRERAVDAGIEPPPNNFEICGL